MAGYESLFSVSTLLYWLPFLLCLGGLSGFLAGLLGVGGGIVLVPALFYGFAAAGFSADDLMHVAIGTSLAIIVPTGMSSAAAHWKRGNIRIDLVKNIGMGIVFGVAVGMVIAAQVTGATLNLVFAISLLLLAAIMLANPVRFIESRAATQKTTRADRFAAQPWAGMMGILIGMLSSLMGIGGATISVPYMTLCGVPIRQAIGTAAMLGLVIAIPAACGFMLIGSGQRGLPPFSLGYVNLPAFLLVAPMAVMAAPFGAAAAHKLPVGILRNVFAAFIALVALKMIYGVLGV